MKTRFTVLLLVVTHCTMASSYRNAVFKDVDYFLKSAQDIVLADYSPPQDKLNHPWSSSAPQNVEVFLTLKGQAKPGTLSVLTRQPMTPGKRYMLHNAGGTRAGVDFLAIAGLSVVPLPSMFSVEDILGKPLKEQVEYIFSRRLFELERELAPMLREKGYLEKAVSDRQSEWYVSSTAVEIGSIQRAKTIDSTGSKLLVEIGENKLNWSGSRAGETGFFYLEKAWNELGALLGVCPKRSFAR